MRIQDALADIEFNDADIPEGAVVLDAFVVYRVQQPDDEAPAIYYATAKSMHDEVVVGTATVFLDRIRDQVRRNWIGED